MRRKMQLTPLSTIAGAMRVESALYRDERGIFARSFCAADFAAAGLPVSFPQHNFSTNAKRGTLRGLHYRDPQASESKLVRCVAGRVWDVIVDLRPQSPSYKQWEAVELAAEKPLALFIPAGCAHGFLTLEDESHLYYLMGAEYDAKTQRGVRWDDPALAIEWPFPPAVISEADARLPFLTGGS